MSPATTRLTQLSIRTRLSPILLVSFLPVPYISSLDLCSTVEAAQSGWANTPVEMGATWAHATLPIFTDTLAEEGAGNRAPRPEEQSTQLRLGSCLRFGFYMSFKGPCVKEPIPNGATDRWENV